MGEEQPTYGSYEEMYRKEYPTVYSYIRRVIRGNDAAVEDLTQEVFFVAYQKWDRILVHPNPPGFLIVVAQNKIKKWFREKKPVYVDDAQLLELMSENGKERGEKDDFFMVDLYSTVEKALSNAELDILRYYYEYGYSSAEMAGRLGITENCFKVRVSRMKAKLKKNVGFLFGLLAALCALLGPSMPDSRAAQPQDGLTIAANASEIRYGQKLGDSVLTGTATDSMGNPVEGDFAWLNGEKRMNQVGTVLETAVFLPEEPEGGKQRTSGDPQEPQYQVTVTVEVQKALPRVVPPSIILTGEKIYDGDRLEDAVRLEGGSASWSPSSGAESLSGSETASGAEATGETEEAAGEAGGADPEDSRPVSGRFVLEGPPGPLEAGRCEISILFLPAQESLFEQVRLTCGELEVLPRPVRLEVRCEKSTLAEGQETVAVIRVKKEEGLTSLNGTFSLFAGEEAVGKNIRPEEKEDCWEARVPFSVQDAGKVAVRAVYSPEDSHTASAEAGTAIRVEPPLSQIVTDRLSGGQEGRPYEETIRTDASGRFGLEFLVTEGELPEGLALDEKKGVLKGTPKDSGTFSFTVSVSEAESRKKAERSFSLEIAQRPRLEFSVSCPDIVYGETLRPQAASEGEGASFRLTYEGIGETDYAPSETPPALPGRYRIVAEVTSPEAYAGQTREAEFEIRKAELKLTATLDPPEPVGGSGATLTVRMSDPSDPGQTEGLPDSLSLDLSGNVEKISGPEGENGEYRYDIRFPDRSQKIRCTIATEENECYLAASVSLSIEVKKKEAPSSAQESKPSRKPEPKEEKEEEEEIVPKTPEEVEAEFWQDVIFRIYRQQEQGGGTVTINAKGHGSMPDSVMEALRGHAEVALALVWEGDLILIPAGKAPASSDAFPSWTLGELSTRYPAAGGQGSSATPSAAPAPVSPAKQPSAPASSVPASSAAAQKPPAREPESGEPKGEGQKADESGAAETVPETELETGTEPAEPETGEPESAAVLAEPQSGQPPEAEVDWFAAAAFLCAAAGGMAVLISAIAMKRRKS